MSRPASNLADGDVAGSSNHTNTIVSGSDDAFGYLHQTGLADMNAICVGAVGWSSDNEFCKPNILAVSNEVMEPFAIKGCYSSYNCVFHIRKLYILQQEGEERN